MSRNKLETKNFLTVSFQDADPPLVCAAGISAPAEGSAELCHEAGLITP